MPAPEGLVVTRLMPGEGFVAADLVQSLWAESLRTVYGEELGMPITGLSQPVSRIGLHNIEDAYGRKVALMNEIESSGDLSSSQQDAFVIARDLSQTEHGGVVGVGKFARTEDNVVTIEDLTVATSLRGRRVGPAILDAAFRALDIDAQDTLGFIVLQQNMRARRFWQYLGFQRQRLLTHTDRPYSYFEYEAAQSVVAANVRARLES
jgi:ribosomal protein S18 acetylase RimI-like enzyme